MRPWIPTLALLVTLAPATFAGGIHARIEGPDKDGITYTARTFSCNPDVALEPWALAEGVVDGKRKSVLIRLEPTDEHGVYRFTRTWPREGRWMIRLALGHPPAPATVATLRSNGTVQSNELYYNTDGFKECQQVLKHYAKPSDDDC